MNFIDYVNSRPVATDKLDLGYFHEFYDRLFSLRERSVRSVLEIGVWSGESLRLWRDYFVHADIYGVDIIERDSKLRLENRIKIAYENAYNENFIAKINGKVFDIIIDDGPHTARSQAFVVKNFQEFVAPGGVLVIEDIIDSSALDLLTSLVNTNEFYHYLIDMRNKCRSCELNERWKNGLFVLILERKH